MTQTLEQKCPYISICAESNYGNDELCNEDYIECPKYKILLERQEKLEEQRRWY